jgi:ABC-type Fe3+/spermidine/putrescine transport system ATPase subunit
MKSTSLQIQSITKTYGGPAALDDVSLDVRPGEFLSLLGSSGCGKTTLLRILAGFVKQTSGSVAFDGQVIDGVAPQHRNTGMVFQNYAIFPHLNVRDNIAYGLRTRGLAAADVKQRVDEMLALIRLEHLGQRLPRELSGGQQQRVVLARALAIKPSVLLMDEPLSNLDTEMRIHLRQEIRSLQKQLGITTVYVTHDQEEALAVSDRIAVMHAGRIEQLGTPREIYCTPRTRFVAGFVGENNFLPVTLRATDAFAGQALDLPGGRIAGAFAGFPQDAAGSPWELAIRPQDVQVQALAENGGARDSAPWRGRVRDSQFLGGQVRHDIDLGGGFAVCAVVHHRHGMVLPQPGAWVGLAVDPGAVQFFAAPVSP